MANNNAVARSPSPDYGSDWGDIAFADPLQPPPFTVPAVSGNHGNEDKDQTAVGSNDEDSNDEDSNDEDSNDEDSNDEDSNDEDSNDEDSNDEDSNDEDSNDKLEIEKDDENDEDYHDEDEEEEEEDDDEEDVIDPSELGTVTTSSTALIPFSVPIAAPSASLAAVANPPLQIAWFTNTFTSINAQPPSAALATTIQLSAERSVRASTRAARATAGVVPKPTKKPKTTTKETTKRVADARGEKEFTYTNSNIVKFDWTVKHSSILNIGTVLRYKHDLPGGVHFTKDVRLGNPVKEPRDAYEWDVLDANGNWVAAGLHTGPKGIAKWLLQNSHHAQKKQDGAWDAFNVVLAGGSLGQTLTDVRRHAARAHGQVDMNDP